MTDTHAIPIPDSYWVEPEHLLAGEYPGHARVDDARAKVRRFVDAGIDCFVDLTEEGELEPYAEYLVEETAEQRGAEHYRMPIRDLSVTTPEHMVRILDLIDDRLRAGRIVYVHCWGGVGRTGTVIGCWLVRHGMRPEQALARIERLRAHTAKAWVPSPETGVQRRMVRDWQEPRSDR